MTLPWYGLDESQNTRTIPVLSGLQLLFTNSDNLHPQANHNNNNNTLYLSAVESFAAILLDALLSSRDVKYDEAFR